MLCGQAFGRVPQCAVNVHEPNQLISSSFKSAPSFMAETCNKFCTLFAVELC